MLDQIASSELFHIKQRLHVHNLTGIHNREVLRRSAFISEKN